MMMRRRYFLILCAAPLSGAGDPAAKSFRGKLAKDPNGNPVLQLADGSRLLLTGDDETTGVLKDKRLAGGDFEVVGKLSGETVQILPIHEAALFSWKDGKRLRVTYWCDICAIRTYTPGLCWCCREETELDLREPDKVDKK